VLCGLVGGLMSDSFSFCGEGLLKVVGATTPGEAGVEAGVEFVIMAAEM
jgi:hypothetical protein